MMDDDLDDIIDMLNKDNATPVKNPAYYSTKQQEQLIPIPDIKTIDEASSKKESSKKKKSQSVSNYPASN
jgi:hypothetical protein